MKKALFSLMVCTTILFSSPIIFCMDDGEDVSVEGMTKLNSWRDARQFIAAHEIVAYHTSSASNIFNRFPAYILHGLRYALIRNNYVGHWCDISKQCPLRASSTDCCSQMLTGLYERFFTPEDCGNLGYMMSVMHPCDYTTEFPALTTSAIKAAAPIYMRKATLEELGQIQGLLKENKANFGSELRGSMNKKVAELIEERKK
jgi:hypothetical protein